MTEFLPGLIGDPNLDEYYGVLLNVLLGVGIAISTIAIILSGIKYMSSRGDMKATDKAKQALTYSVIAFILTVGAFSFKGFIMDTLGITSTEISGAVPGF